MWLSAPMVVIAVTFAWEGPGRGESMSSNRFTGVEWQVSEFSSHAVAPAVDRQQPFIFFDTASKQATGFAGCNRFLAGTNWKEKR
jgi:heat shock protein HslJ